MTSEKEFVLERIFLEIDPEMALAFDDTFYQRVFDLLKNTASFIPERKKLGSLMMKSREKPNSYALSLGFRLLTCRVEQTKAFSIEDLNFWLSAPLDCKFAKSLLEYCVCVELENDDLVEDFALRALRSEYDFLTESACKILCKSARITEIIHSLLGSDKFGLLSKVISLAEASLSRINQQEMLQAFCAVLERMQKRNLVYFARFSRKCTQFPKKFLDLPCQFLFLNGHCVYDSLQKKVKEFILVADEFPQFLKLNLDFIEEHLELLKELPELWEFLVSLASRSKCWLETRAISLLERAIPHSKSFSLPPVNANSFRLHLKVASSSCLDYLMKLKLKEENAQDFESVLCALQSCEWPFSQVDFELFLSYVYALFHDDEHCEKDSYLVGTMIQFLCKHGKLRVFDILARIEFDSHLKLCALQCLGPVKREEFALLKPLVHDSDLEVRALVGKIALENANAFPKETGELIEILKHDESSFVRNSISNGIFIQVEGEMTIDEYLCDFDAFLSANVSMSHDCYC